MAASDDCGGWGDGAGCPTRRDSGGDACGAFGESKIIAVAATATSGSATNRAGRRKRHSGLPVIAAG